MALPKRQNPLDWTTQAWNIALGRKVEPDVDSWLMGPIGKVNEQADAFINRLAEQHGLSIVYDGPGSGLVESVESWGVSIPPKTASFYTQTSSYAFEVKTLWRPGFASLGAWVARLFSRRIQQLNLPGDSLDKSIVFKSEIIQLIDAQGKVHFTIWRRSNHVTGETIFFGIYTTCRTPSGQICIKAIFPLPCGSATVLFGIEKDTQGNLLLRSTGKRYGDPGFYFIVEDSVGTLWKHYLPSFRESICISEDEQGSLRAHHELKLWCFRVYSMDYDILPKRSERAPVS